MTRNPLLNQNANPELDIQQLARIHDLARTRAEQLRQDAISAFWGRLFAMLQRGFLRPPRKTIQLPH